MKRTWMVLLAVALVGVLVFAALPVMAAKPPDVILRSNGYPSGLHFNMNIHGKNESFTCTTISGGNSIFVDEYGPATIQYQIDKRGSLSELWVEEGCAIDGGTAIVHLPWNIITDDGERQSADGYYAYARIHGKPQNGTKKNDDPEPSTIFVSRHRVTSAFIPDPNDPAEYIPLGLFTSNRVYVADGEVFSRWEDPNAPTGKGKQGQAHNITELLMWYGWMVDESLDIAGPGGLGADGVVDDYDVPGDAAAKITAAGKNPADYEPWGPNDGVIDVDDGNGIIDVIEEWLAFQAEENPDLCEYIEDWIWNAGEWVISEQDIQNDGTKLLQVRFYPVSTTTFTEASHIVVKKLTNSETDYTTLFDFTRTNPDLSTVSFGLKKNQSTLDELEPGIYTIEESVTAGWYLDSITISDPTGGSDASISDPLASGSASVNLTYGETVIVTFTNKSGSLEILKTDDSLTPVLLPGATFVINPNPKLGGTGYLEVTDNGANDEDPADGVLLVTGCTISDTQTYIITETQAPSGYLAGSPQPGVTIDSPEKVTLTFENTLE